MFDECLDFNIIHLCVRPAIRSHRLYGTVRKPAILFISTVITLTYIVVLEKYIVFTPKVHSSSLNVILYFYEENGIYNNIFVTKIL